MNEAAQPLDHNKIIIPLLPANLSLDQQQAAFAKIERCLLRYEYQMQSALPGNERTYYDKPIVDKDGMAVAEISEEIDGAKGRRAFAAAVEKTIDAFHPEFFYDEDATTLKRFEEAMKTLEEMTDIAERDAERISAEPKWETRGGAMDRRFETLLSGLMDVWRDCGGSIGGHAKKDTRGGPLINFLCEVCGIVMGQRPTPDQARGWIRKLEQ